MSILIIKIVHIILIQDRFEGTFKFLLQASWFFSGFEIQFHSTEHLFDVISASCFIPPLYSSPLRVMANIMTHYASELAHDVAKQETKENHQHSGTESHTRSFTTTNSQQCRYFGKSNQCHNPIFTISAIHVI